MPRLPAIPLPVLRSLEAQLRHAPRETLLRDVERVEELARDIRPEIQYPHDWVTFRVTGYRPDSAPPGTVSGTDLLAALSPFVEVLCERAGLRTEELDASAFVRASTLASDWSASPATLKRWRRDGLITRRARADAGRTEVWVSRLCADHFRTTHAPALARAVKTTRLSPAQRELLLAKAQSLRSQGFSLHAAAKQIAQENSRSVEGVRQLLLSDKPTRTGFVQPRQRTPRDPQRRLIALHRLWRQGADPADLAHLVGKSVPLVRRDINLARAALLRSWLATGALDGPALDALTPITVTTISTPTLSPPQLLSTTLTDWRSRTPLPRAHEHSLTHAFHTLRATARNIATSLNHLHPSAERLDEAETSLRYASTCRAALLHSQHRLLLETLEARAGLPLDRLLPAVAVRLMRESLAAATQALDHFDPSKGGRLAGPVGLAVDRCAVRTLRDALPPRASTRAMVLQPETTITFPPLSPWDKALLPDPRIVRALSLAPSSHADSHLSLLADRFGLAGAAPRTLRELREARGLTSITVARSLQRALAHCLRNNPA